MYTMLVGLRTSVGASTGEHGSDGVAESGRTSGRPANGLLDPSSESARRCASRGAGMMGMLLLLGSCGRACFSCSSIGVVSVRLKLVNFDGGGGREPIGRDALWERRSLRYEAACVSCKSVSSTTVHSLSLDGLGGVYRSAL